MINKVFKRIFLIIFLVFTLISVSSINILGIEGKNDQYSNISQISTNELIDIIVNDEIFIIYCYSNKDYAIDIFKEGNKLYIELLRRNNVEQILLKKLLNEKDELIKENINLLLEIINKDISNTKVNSRITIEQYDDIIYTPNGSSIYGKFTNNEFDIDKQDQIHKKLMDKYSYLENQDYIYPANSSYNCHSYAFYSCNPYTNNFFLLDPYKYLDDDSYDPVVDIRKGDILWYFSNAGANQTTPYITHSAIIVDFPEGMTAVNISNYSQITVESKWGEAGVYRHKANQCPFASLDQLAYIQVIRPRTDKTFNISDESGIINDSTNIAITYENSDKYEMYELNPSITKCYEFRSSSSSSLDVRLYDVHMQLIDFDDLNSSSSTTHFKIKLFKKEIYYLRVAYVSNTAVGTINTQIITKETIEIDYGMNTLDGEYYSYCNVDDTGMYKISLISNTNSTTFPYGSIIVYGDDYKISPIKRLSTSLYELEAVSDNNCNNLIVYLEIGKTYYIDIDLPIANYSNISLKFERIYDIEEIDLNNNECTIMNNETQVGDNFERINILNDSTVAISYDYNGSQSENIYFVLYKEEYNANTGFNEIELIFPEMMVTYGESLTWTSDIEEGIYYIGYYNKTNSTSTISISIN